MQTVVLYTQKFPEFCSILLQFRGGSDEYSDSGHIKIIKIAVYLS